MKRIATLKVNWETGEGDVTLAKAFAALPVDQGLSLLYEAQQDLSRLVSLAYRNMQNEYRRTDAGRFRRPKDLCGRYVDNDRSDCALVVGDDGGGTLVVNAAFCERSWLFILDVAGDWKGVVGQMVETLQDKLHQRMLSEENTKAKRKSARRR